MFRSKGLLLGGFFFVLSLNAMQSNANAFVHHVIILIDRSNPMDINDNRKNGIKYLMTTALEELCFKNGLVVKGRKLLEKSKGDYLSIISHGMERENPDFGQFIQIVKDTSNKSFSFRRDYAEGMFRNGNLIAAINNKNRYADFFHFHWSGISLAMPMGIHFLGKSNKNYEVNKTYLIHITDYDYNAGADSILEIDLINTISNSDGYQVIGSSKARDIYKNVQATFLWDRVPVDDPYEKEQGQIKLKIFEFIPIAKVFAIESLIQYDVRNFYFKRTYGGYESDFHLMPINQDSPFYIRNIEVKLVDDRGNVVNNNQTQFANVESLKKVKFFLNQFYPNVSDKLSVKLKFWVHWKNAVYGVHVLHPDGSLLQGAQGLNRTLNVQFEKTLSVWGIIPLGHQLYNCSAKYLGNSQIFIKSFWEAASALLVIITMIFFIFMSIHKFQKHYTIRNIDDNEFVFNDFNS